MSIILIVEDDQVNVKVFFKILIKRGGLNVKYIEDVEEVVKIVRLKEVDLILMDVFLICSVYNGKVFDGI